MEDKNKDNPIEIPDNNPTSETKPIRSAREKKKGQVIKIAYAFALLLALGGGLLARIISEKNLGNLNTPIEQDYVTRITVPEQTSPQDYEVRQNKTDVPDTRPMESTTEKETEKETQTTTEKASQYAVPFKDYYTLPAGTQISKEYLPKTPVYNATTDDWRTHPAIDFNVADGSQIKAISTGTVLRIYDDVLLGTVAELDHGNGVIARYCGLNKDTIEIKEGSSITQGQVIGYLGTVPFEKSEISHLHFEIKHNGEYVDPLELMGK